MCARHLEGRDPLAIRDRVADLRVALDGYLGWEGLSSQTAGAVEIALWDILGKTLDAPVHRLLGGSAHPIPLYGTGTTMFEESAQWHAHYFDQCMDLGFAGVKVRLGRTIDGDTEAVATVREHIGPDKLMGVDSYWFHDPDSAIELCRRIAGYGIHFFEEPVPQYQIEGLERLQHNSAIRVAVGERVYSPRMYAELARRDAARVFEPDACLTGGILSCLEIADLAARSSIEVIPHVGGPTVVGLAANLHWATAARVRLCEYDIDPHQPMITDIGHNPGLALTDLGGGHITAPHRSGPRRGSGRGEAGRPPLPRGATPTPSCSPSTSRAASPPAAGRWTRPAVGRRATPAVGRLTTPAPDRSGRRYPPADGRRRTAPAAPGSRHPGAAGTCTA